MYEESYVPSPEWFEDHPEVLDLELYVEPVYPAEPLRSGRHMGEIAQVIRVLKPRGGQTNFHKLTVRQLVDQIRPGGPVMVDTRSYRNITTGFPWTLTSVEALCRALRTRTTDSNPVYLCTSSETPIPKWASVLLSSIELSVVSANMATDLWPSIHHWYKTDVVVICQTPEDVADMADTVKAHSIPIDRVTIAPGDHNAIEDPEMELILKAATRYGFALYPEQDDW